MAYDWTGTQGRNEGSRNLSPGDFNPMYPNYRSDTISHFISDTIPRHPTGEGYREQERGNLNGQAMGEYTDGFNMFALASNLLWTLIMKFLSFLEYFH